MILCFVTILWAFIQPASLGVEKNNPYYEVLFPPKHKCLPRILKLLDEAKKSIYVQCYSFTSQPIAHALLNAHKRGVKVRVITDKSQIKATGSVVPLLALKGVSVWVDKNVAIAHNKVMLIDKKILLLGSYNWTKAAENRNAENLLIVYNHAGLIKDYSTNWTERRKASIKFSKQLANAA